MASSCLRTAINLPCKKARFRHSFQAIRAQSYRDEGRSRNKNTVDANLRVLWERIEEVRTKERLERWCMDDHQIGGWNYADFETSYKAKREKEFVELLQLLGNIGGTFGFTILNCSFCLCLFSLLLHLNQ